MTVAIFIGVCQSIRVPSRGRPPLQTDETILDAALRSFAVAGFDATSVRALNAELGLSHETITQRFGTKADLFRAAVRHGVTNFVDTFDREVATQPADDDLDRLRAVVRAFIIASSLHPNIGELLHRGGLAQEERAALTSAVGLDERLVDTVDLLRRLRSASLIGDVSMREMWFLLQAGAAPLHFRPLATMFDPFDGPIDDAQHVERMVALAMRAIGAAE